MIPEFTEVKIKVDFKELIAMVLGNGLRPTVIDGQHRYLAQQIAKEKEEQDAQRFLRTPWDGNRRRKGSQNS